MAKRVFVTGLGIITSIGNNLPENLASLLASRTGIKLLSRPETVHKGILHAGEIALSDPELALLAGIEWQEGLTRTALLGMIAAREAVGPLTAAPLAPQRKMEHGTRKMEHEGDPSGDALRTGLICGSTVGGMVATEKYYLDYLEQERYNPWIEANECSESTERIARHLGIRGFVSTVNTACSSSANAIMLGARMIRSGKLDRVVAGGMDALSVFTLNGFNTLMIYDKNHCRPFDQSRNGLNLGEGAAFLVLEPEEAVQDKKPLCELTGWGNSTDAFHQTALSPEGKGPYLAMEMALKRSGLRPEEISYINAHGTATQNNDLAESNAMIRLFGDHMPPFSSTKAFTGHLLGASGAVEAVFSVLSILNGLTWPNLHFTERMEETGLEPVTRLEEGQEIRHVLSNSFGFGGNNTSLIFSAV